MMMTAKRLPLLWSLVLFVLLCATGTYWGLQLFKPAQRPVALPPPPPPIPITLMDAVPLFGGQVTAVATNYFLKGVVVADLPSQSVAILATDDKPAQALVVGSAVAPGVTLEQVDKTFVVLKDGGQAKRVELPAPTPGADLPPGLATSPGFTPQYGGGTPQYAPPQYSPPQYQQQQYQPPQYGQAPDQPPPGGYPGNIPGGSGEGVQSGFAPGK